MGPERVRQVHRHEHPRLPRPPDGRRLSFSRSGRRRAVTAAARAAAAPLSRIRLPGIQPAQPNDGARERRAPARLSWRRRDASGISVRAKRSRRSGSTGWESPHAGGALGWTDATRGDRAGPLSTEPSVLFADEPTGQSRHRAERRDSWNRSSRSIGTRGLTVVMVTHEPDMAAYASRTIRFRDGHVESDERTEGVH